MSRDFSKPFNLSLALGVLAAVMASSWARAEPGYLDQTVFPPSKAFELSLSTGYTQGFGNLSPSNPIVRSSGAGVGFTGELAYRVSPLVSVGVGGQFATFATENNTSASRGLELNVGATVHGKPDSRGDPWARLGAGYRFLWDGPREESTATNQTTMFQGFELVRAEFGYDVRESSNLALGPFIGADLQSFVWQGSTTLSPAQWGTFLYAGIQGRLDAGGKKPPAPQPAPPPP